MVPCAVSCRFCDSSTNLSTFTTPLTTRTSASRRLEVQFAPGPGFAIPARAFGKSRYPASARRPVPGAPAAIDAASLAGVAIEIQPALQRAGDLPVGLAGLDHQLVHIHAVEIHIHVKRAVLRLRRPPGRRREFLRRRRAVWKEESFSAPVLEAPIRAPCRERRACREGNIFLRATRGPACPRRAGPGNRNARRRTRATRIPFSSQKSNAAAVDHRAGGC